MAIVFIPFLLSTVILALAASHIVAAIEGNESLIGLPQDSGVPLLLGVIIAVTASGTLLAPFAVAVQRVRSNRRPTRRRMR